MRLSRFSPTNYGMLSLIPYIFLFFLRIEGIVADGLHFTSVPIAVTPGTRYIITWSYGADTEPCSVTLYRGRPGDLQVVSVLTTTATNGIYNWMPSKKLTNGGNYGLMIKKTGVIEYSAQFSLRGGKSISSSATDTPSSIRSALSTTAAATMSTKASPFLVTETVTAIPSTTPKPTTSASSTSLLDPRPTSSWDREKPEDDHLTQGDKIAIGIGIPIFLIALSTLGYWRAVRYFLYRKIIGEPELPAFGYRAPEQNSDDALAFGSRANFGASRTSLWGASSTPGSPAPVSGFGDTELLTAPRKVYTPDPIRPSTSNTFRSSKLREWHPV